MTTDIYKEAAFSLGRKAGEIINTNFTLGMSKQWKSDNTPVTASDLAINQLVIDTIKEKFPQHGVLGEEQSWQAEAEYLWVCDPVDGTQPFSTGVPTCVFSLALTKDGETQLALINDPFTDRLFFCELGGRATVNNKEIKINDSAELRNTYVALSSRMTIEGMKTNGQIYDLLEGMGAKIFNFRSIVYAGALVASGELTAMVCGIKHPWDGAALSLLVEQAGGRVTDLRGERRKWDRPGDGILASNGAVHDQMLGILADPRPV